MHDIVTKPVVMPILMKLIKDYVKNWFYKFTKYIDIKSMEYFIFVNFYIQKK